MRNPFDPMNDPDRHHIWDRLVRADTEAFVTGNWSIIEHDFHAKQFEGIRCNHSANPDDWTIAFPHLEEYRDSWLVASQEFVAKKFLNLTPADAIYRRCRLDRIDIVGDRALAHKKFSGEVPLADGSTLSGDRQTIYRLHRTGGDWRIVGFLGQLPLDERT
ncbi:MAG: hypothetical protein QOF78_1718 [Phycisphaerales bacterium]|jgi:hypothetical protein|nr:hypothetical protein [Phycisphaerales bacterium]